MAHPSRVVKVCCAIGLLCAVIGIGFWLSGNNSGNHGGIQAGHFWTRLKHVESSKRLTAKWFKSFAIARSRPETLNPRIGRDIEKTLGVDPDTFHDPQYAHTQEGGMWLVWARGSACILHAGSGAVSCATLGTVVREGLPLGMAKRLDGRTRVYELLGIAPDWAKAVRLKVGKRIRRALIHHNAYSYRANSRILIEELERR